MEAFEISYGDIFEYVGDKKRCLKEGEAVFNAGHILACGVKASTEEVVEVGAFCAQTSGLRDKPHELNVSIRKDGVKFKVVCSCKAGMSEMCKHCVAVLIYLNRNPPGQLSHLSCTDTAQAWGKVKGRDWYQGVTLSDMCHVQENPYKIKQLTSEEEVKCLEILTEACPDSALTLHGTRKRKRLADVEPPVDGEDDFVAKLIDSTCGQLHVHDEAFTDQFYIDVVMLTYPESVRLCRETVSQCSERWRHARSVRITASECYGLYTATANWEAKFQRTGKFSGSAATRFGTTHEPVARSMFIAETGYMVHQCGLVVPPMLPWLACSPDGVVDTGASLKLLEIKCPALCESVDLITNVRAKKLPYLQLEGENLALKKKHKYYGQVQLCMTLLDLDACYFVVYEKANNVIHVLLVDRDDEFCGDLVRKLGFVYFEHFLPYLKRINRAT